MAFVMKTTHCLQPYLLNKFGGSNHEQHIRRFVFNETWTIIFGYNDSDSNKSDNFTYSD